MNKYRPERIELKCPLNVADKFEAWLREELHKRAKLERSDNGKQTVFAFWPTKSEYFYIMMVFKIKAEEFSGRKLSESP